MKFYDVRSFDMIAVLNLSFSPGTTTFVSRKNALISRVAVADTESSVIHIVSPSRTPAVIKTLKIHVAPVTAMAYVYVSLSVTPTTWIYSNLIYNNDADTIRARIS